MLGTLQPICHVYAKVPWYRAEHKIGSFVSMKWHIALCDVNNR